MDELLLLHDVEIDGKGPVDCRIRHGRVVDIGASLTREPEERDVAGHGGALLPGLADHHLHLLAMGAAARSINLARVPGPVAAAIAAAASTPHSRGGLRLVEYDDVRHGYLNRAILDLLAPATPVRVQHRSGGLWVLNSLALTMAGLDDGSAPPGAERDEFGTLTGRLWHCDEWLRGHFDDPPPDLTAIGSHLARLGVTAVTDATPNLDASSLVLIRRAVESGALPHRLQLLGVDTSDELPPRVTVGPRKIVISDHSLPDPDDLTDRVAHWHRRKQSVAIHCVTRAALAIALAALRTAGVRNGDRIEHCALADSDAIAQLAALRVIVVTQPTLVERRGDDYWTRHSRDERPDLWRFRSLLDSGVRTVASSDAPYGDINPWATLAAARDRQTANGHVLGPAERVSPAVTLRGLLAPLASPGGPPRRVSLGAPADIILLDRPLHAVLAGHEEPSVVLTLIGGRQAS